MPRGFLRDALLAIGVAEEVADAALSTVSRLDDHFVNYVKFIKLVWGSNAIQEETGGASGAVVGSIPSREAPAPALTARASPTRRELFDNIDELAKQALGEVSPQVGDAMLQMMLLCLRDPSAYVMRAVEFVKEVAPEWTARASPRGCLARGVAGATRSPYAMDELAWQALEELSLEGEEAILVAMLECRRNPSAYIMTAVESVKSRFPAVAFTGAEPPPKRPRYT